MIDFREVTKKFGKTTVLDKINFTIPKGSFHFLVGQTGAGKTTIFRLVIKDLHPDMGEIMVADMDLGRLSKSKIPHLRRKVGVIFQDLKLLMDRTVIENIMLPLEFTGLSEKQVKEKSMESIESVGLTGMVDKFPLQLSGGERQRVAIARALVFDPEILLADEPTGNLDLEASHHIVDLLEGINKKGTTIFMATHNEKVIEKNKQKVITISDGKIVGALPVVVAAPLAT